MADKEKEAILKDRDSYLQRLKRQLMEETDRITQKTSTRQMANSIKRSLRRHQQEEPLK